MAKRVMGAGEGAEGFIKMCVSICLYYTSFLSPVYYKDWDITHISSILLPTPSFCRFVSWCACIWETKLFLAVKESSKAVSVKVLSTGPADAHMMPLWSFTVVVQLSYVVITPVLEYYNNRESDNTSTRQRWESRRVKWKRGEKRGGV